MEAELVVELKGSLSDVGLAAVIELIGEVHRSGNLGLRKGSAHGVLAFADGRLVAAECGEHRGLQALADCALELGDGEFTFVEGTPPTDRTLDLGPSELKNLMTSIASGDFQARANGHTEDTQQGAQTICPMLGFADDRSRRYSRATALHRCYASGAAALVTAQEQRELCFSGQFAVCPRYANPHATAVAVATAPSAPASPPAPETAAPVQAHDASRRARESQSVDSGRGRGIIVIAAVAVAGFLVVGLLILLAQQLLRPEPQPELESAAAVEPGGQTARVATPVSSTPAAAPTAQPLAALTTVAIAPTATLAAPTALPIPTVAVQTDATRSLMDVRFAGGPADNWLNNPPFAAWSDGAYRFQAHDETRFVAAGVPINQVLTDVVVSATFRKTGGPPGGGYGLILRDQGPEPRDGVNQEMTAYVFETGDLGEYGVWRRDGDHWVDLVSWKPFNSVRSGGSPNDLSVRASGDMFTFTVNGAVVATLQDDTLDAGGVGLFVGGDHNEVALDHFSVELLD